MNERGFDLANEESLSAQYDGWLVEPDEDENEDEDEDENEVQDEGEGAHEDEPSGRPPSFVAITARFGSMFNALALAGCLDWLPPDDQDMQMAEYIEGALQLEGTDSLSPASRHALMANGLAHYMWRNGPIETVHAGDGLGALSDGDMMRTNAFVCSLVAEEMSFGDNLLPDLIRLRRRLLDPQLVWPTGETLWALCEGYIGELAGAINGAIAGGEIRAARTSVKALYNFVLYRGTIGEASRWAGSPWWPFTVQAFIEDAQAPKEWYDGLSLVEKWPPPLALSEVERLLLQPLHLMPAEVADWCAPGLSFASDAGRKAWQEAGSPDV